MMGRVVLMGWVVLEGEEVVLACIWTVGSQ